jgi:two-component system sensor histidine kinase TctE
VYLGLARGISPLVELRRLIRSRRPDDLSPIDTARVPHEVRPLVGAFNAMMHRLAANLGAQKRFIADAAHQMRTPLTGLKMQTELAINETDPEQLRRLLPNLALSTNRACHLINQLLMLARAESHGGAPAIHHTVDLEALVVETASAMVFQARAKRIDLELIRPQAAVIIRGDALMLRELIKNLLDNAIKYTPDNGHVVVRLQAHDQAVIEIEDDGIGIPPAERPHVFERFYRVLGTASEGSGLGLSIVREIANQHQATVELAGNPSGKGCLARVCFPLVMPAAANSAEHGEFMSRHGRVALAREA